MDRSLARTRYVSQRNGAKSRGIEFKLTFEQWLEFWGDDLDKRGNRPWSLQMCRIGDKGCYELGNIYKGTARHNALLANQGQRHRLSVAARESILKAEWEAETVEGPEYIERSEDEEELAKLGCSTMYERHNLY